MRNSGGLAATRVPNAGRPSASRGRSHAPACARVGALCASLVLLLPAAARSGAAPGHAARRGAAETGFCVPLSPRCFHGRRPRHVRTGDRDMSTVSAGGSRHHQQVTRTDCLSAAESQAMSFGPSLDSSSSTEAGSTTPRKHLGPTAEEIVAERRKEALVRKAEVLNSWRCDLCYACCPKSLAYLCPVPNRIVFVLIPALLEAARLKNLPKTPFRRMRDQHPSG